MATGSMVTQVIKSWLDGSVLFSCEVSADLSDGLRIKAALEIGVKARAYLSRADLSGADLSRAYLSRAYLSGADLSGADLSRAYLSRAYLSGADLSGADLSRAYLSRAYLSGADLSGANLSGADLSGANLSGHKIIPGASRSDGYAFMLTNLGDDGWRIKAGCRNFTIQEALEHWSKPRDLQSLNDESLLIVSQLLALAKLRGWEVVDAEVASV